MGKAQKDTLETINGRIVKFRNGLYKRVDDIQKATQEVEEHINYVRFVNKFFGGTVHQYDNNDELSSFFLFNKGAGEYEQEFVNVVNDVKEEIAENYYKLCQENGVEDEKSKSLVELRKEFEAGMERFFSDVVVKTDHHYVYPSNKRKHQIIFCRGLQASGKSTWARKWAEEKPLERIRISTDDIRRMFGVYWIPQREQLVANVAEKIMDAAILAEYDIVVDSMNLSEERMEGPVTDAEMTALKNGKEYEILYMPFYSDLEECIRRDLKRENPIGETVIRETYERNADEIEQEINVMAKKYDGKPYNITEEYLERYGKNCNK